MTVTFGFGADDATLLPSARAADRDGLDYISLSDHPYLGGRIDAYAALGFVLGATERLSGFVNVTNLPLRPAPMLARTVAGLSALSGGRIVLGAGAGGRWERIASMGVPALSPGQAVDAFEEAITLIRSLCGGGAPVTHHGQYYSVTGLETSPEAAPPVWTGSVGPRSLAATGRVADGWIPGHAADWRSDRYRAGRAIIDEAAASAGRDPGDVRTIFNLPGRITDQPLPATRSEEGRWIGGSPAQWVAELTEAVRDHGASGFMLFSPTGGAPDETTLARWAHEIAPAVRHAVPTS
ncbi:LLM class flavin-dependent oxidoreductase [Actinoplanes sp. NBRC 103695]|uniref:LLM class flavin-dependent oxidoreductase n=1 Tax=Actinoplanes sp. NBRC 103695 TaxID=3032202 RepID=UPI0024A20BE0|nr:LLM class flavin-dependent oxidoreductase [Actinoplanes sp. NBRC 103695]GLZ00381.1 N5,N10-methylene tetrahydromethanopterin reductase [Actinoplanes sp. NBRC 103695]